MTPVTASPAHIQPYTARRKAVTRSAVAALVGNVAAGFRSNGFIRFTLSRAGLRVQRRGGAHVLKPHVGVCPLRRNGTSHMPSASKLHEHGRGLLARRARHDGCIESDLSPIS